MKSDEAARRKKPRGNDSQRRFGFPQGNLTAVGLEVRMVDRRQSINHLRYFSQTKETMQ
ncbi:MAG TPA: hypothetical protein VF278_25440 [Pirellulales bacterium]